MAEEDPKYFLTAGQEAVIRHWSTYGQRGTTPARRALPWDWEHTEFLFPKSATWDVLLEPHHLPLLVLGFTPVTPANDRALIVDTFRVGDIVTTHGFMSASGDPKMKASEDKWFIYATGPDPKGEICLNMYRSWTGTKLFELKISAGVVQDDGVLDEKARISQIIWESDPAQWRNPVDEQKAKEMAREICRWVMNVDLSGKNEFDQPLLSYDKLMGAAQQIPSTGEMTTYSLR